MRAFPVRGVIAAALLFLIAVSHLAGGEPPIILTSPAGTTLTFEEADGTWTWTELRAPGIEDGRAVTEFETPLAVNGEMHLLANRWNLVEQAPERLAFEQVSHEAGLALRRVYTFGDAPHVVRIETWVRSLAAENILTGVGLLDLRVRGEWFRETGEAPASFPLFGRSLFIGIEHVTGRASSGGRSAHLWQTPHLKFGETWTHVATAVVGWVQPEDDTVVTRRSRTRAAFLRYLDTIRVKPADLELHTNTWWSLPLPFSEQDVLAHIEQLRQGFTTRTGKFFDSFALDLGWSDSRSIWKPSADRFPSEFMKIDENLRALGSRMGIWVSPGSAYPEGLDNHWLQAGGYEVTPQPIEALPSAACFALGGRYQAEFRENLLRLVRDYGIRHVKLDYMSRTCDVAEHGHPTGYDSSHAIDAGLADVLDALRAQDPNIVLEPLCCGYPPSPWWTMKTPYVLGPYGDDVPYGRVPSPDWTESLITARDIAYRQDQERWIMPTQALETIDIVMQNPGNFENLAVMAIGRGRWFLSTYLKPEMMTGPNWEFLAALVDWARANKQYLVNADQIGGDPAEREAYGYMFRNPGKDIYCIRNPWIEERALELPVTARLGEPREVRMIYPRRETVARLMPGESGPSITLAGYETVILETVPAGPEERFFAQHAAPDFEVRERSPVRIAALQRTDEHEEELEVTSFTYNWNGDIVVPPTRGAAEICILVEGGPQVDDAWADIVVNGRLVNARTLGSARQFGAASSPSPENWKWFIAPVTAGQHSLRIHLEAPIEGAAVGVFVRGSMPAPSDPAPEGEIAFPLSSSTERTWTKTVVPMQEFRMEEPVETAGM